MKKLYFILFSGLFLVSAAHAKTEVPVLKKVTTSVKTSQKTTVSKAAQASRFNVGSNKGANPSNPQEPPSPLDDPFTPRYTYPIDEKVSTNVVALFMALSVEQQPEESETSSTSSTFSVGSGTRFSVGSGTGTRSEERVAYATFGCSGLRFHKRWFATAAHCLEPFGTKNNPRVSVGIEQLPNGVWQAEITPPSTDSPANATIYFYRKGYSSQSDYGTADDIAVIGLDKKDKLLEHMQQQNKELKDMVNANEHMLASNAFIKKQVSSAQANSQKKVNKAVSDKKHFLSQPLDDYHFMTFSPERARVELAGRPAKGYYFHLGENESPKLRKLPQSYDFNFNTIEDHNDHTVIWNSAAIEGTSGSPVIINGFVVGLLSSGIEGSGIPANQGRGTALLTDDFQAFLKRVMGADYKQGLCVRSNSATEEAITERSEK